MRVLVCDDEGLTASWLCTCLSLMGYDVVGKAQSGIEAVESVQSLKPDVVLMDVDMPGMDGIQATHRIMETAPTAVVILTGFSEDVLVDRALAAGAMAFLVKPVLDTQLRPALTMAHQRFQQAQAHSAALRKLETEHAEAMRAARVSRELRTLLEQEREAARRLVEMFLPRPPELPGFTLACLYEPASASAQVGGDFYDFFPIDAERHAIVLGDVCGKGMAAASYTSLARHMLRAYAAEDPSPARVLPRLNRALCDQMSRECAFLTLVYGLLHLPTGRFAYATGGHPPPVLGRLRASEAEVLPTTGGLLGMLPEMNYREEESCLEEGDTLVLYTDGLSEAHQVTGRLFGVYGIRRVVHSLRHAPVAELTASLMAEAEGHGGGSLRDDAAVLVLRRSAVTRRVESIQAGQ